MKIEQIAIASKDPLALITALNAVFGLKEGSWVHDLVTAQGKVFGVEAINVAQLHFNYDLGFELEVLRYEAGNNWHNQRNKHPNEDQEEDWLLPNVLSHIGFHVTEIEMVDWRNKMLRLGFNIAQDVTTISHTNPAIAGKRKYRYVVFDSIDKLGFDLKLIQRIDI